MNINQPTNNRQSNNNKQQTTNNRQSNNRQSKKDKRHTKNLKTFHFKMIFTIENYEPYTGEYYCGEGVYIDLTEAELDEMLKQELGEEISMEKEPRKKGKRQCRDARERFVDGQKIRHRIGNTGNTWNGVYNLEKNTIACNGIEYSGCSPLNQFATSHYKTDRPDRTYNANAWTECECDENGEWVSTDRSIE